MKIKGEFMTSLILKKINKMKNVNIALLISIFVAAYSLAWMIGFFAIPFITFSNDMRIVFLVVWLYCSIQIFLEIMIDYSVKRRKTTEENKENKFIFWATRVSVLLCFISTFFLVFLKNNFYENLSIWIIISFPFFAIFLTVIIISLISSYENKYKELLKDLFKTSLVMLALILIIVGLLLNKKDTMIISKVLLSIGTIPLFFGGLKLAIQKIMMSNDSKKDQTEIIASTISLFFSIGIVCAIFIFYVVDEKFAVVLATILGAVLGGAITLLGVAWTIKDNNEKRKQDLQRVEDERKEEERKKHIPYISTVVEAEVSNYICVTKVKWLNLKKPEDVAKIKNNSYYVIKFENFSVKNLSNSNIIFEGIYIDDNYYDFDYEKLLETKGVLCVQFPNDMWYEFADKVSYIALQVADILGNHYKVSCEYSQRLHCQPRKDIVSNGEEYMVHPYVCSIESISLPKLL